MTQQEVLVRLRRVEHATTALTVSAAILNKSVHDYKHAIETRNKDTNELVEDINNAVKYLADSLDVFTREMEPLMGGDK